MIFSTLLSAGLSWLLLNWFTPQLRNLFLDHPNSRSSHQSPIPRGGGLAFVFIASACSAVALISGQLAVVGLLPLFAVPLAIVGLIDDRYSLPASWRYGAQLFTAFLMLCFSPLVQSIGFAVLFSSLFCFAFVWISITAVINFTNFMDGLDGLLAGCMAVTIAALAIDLDAHWPMWSLVGSLFGFLLWNWSPAKVFMGDVGSTFLGAVFAGLVLQASSWPEAFGCLLVATPLLGDACICVPRRLLAGQRVFEAHRLHLFQRLHQAGWSHAKVSLTYIAATVLLAVALLAGGKLLVFSLAFVELLVGVWLDQRVAVPFAVASKS